MAEAAQLQVSDEVAITIEGMNKWYGQFHVLRDINLTVYRGERIVICGPSGSGKSTLIRHLNRLIDPSAGEILVDGTDVMQLGQGALRDLRQKQMSMVFQKFALLPHNTVLENAQLPLSVQGADKATCDAEGRKWLARVGLEGFEDRYPAQLSGGMQQRASIARALAVQPDMLLMDEPFGALDEIVRDHLNEQLLKLWAATKKTVVFVTHSIPEAVFLSTKIVVMSPRPGRIYDIVDCDLGDERPLEIRETPEFLKIAQRVRDGLKAGHAYD